MAIHKVFVNFTRGELISPVSFDEPGDRDSWLDPRASPDARFVRIVAFLMNGPWCGDRVGFYGDYMWEPGAGGPCREDQILPIFDFVDVSPWAIEQWNLNFSDNPMKPRFDGSSVVVPSRHPVPEWFQIDAADVVEGNVHDATSNVVFRFRCFLLSNPSRTFSVTVHASPDTRYAEIALFLCHLGLDGLVKVSNVVERSVGQNFLAFIHSEATDLQLRPDGALQRPSPLDWFTVRNRIRWSVQSEP